MHADAHRRSRRRFVQATGAGALAAAFSPGPARAQAARRYAVVSLIGDELVVVYLGLQTGTLLDPNRSRTVTDPADASIPLLDTRMGTGKLHGLGFYVDTHARIRMADTGATDTGLLATYAYFTLTLAEAQSGAVLNQRHSAAARPYPVAASKTVMDPWDVLKPAEKVARLRGLLQRELTREIPLLVAA